MPVASLSQTCWGPMLALDGVRSQRTAPLCRSRGGTRPSRPSRSSDRQKRSWQTARRWRRRARRSASLTTRTTSGALGTQQGIEACRELGGSGAELSFTPGSAPLRTRQHGLSETAARLQDHSRTIHPWASGLATLALPPGLRRAQLPLENWHHYRGHATDHFENSRIGVQGLAHDGENLWAPVNTSPRICVLE